MAKVAKDNIYADVPIAGSKTTRKTLVAARGQTVPVEFRHLVPDDQLVEQETRELNLAGGTVIQSTAHENAVLQQRSDLEKLERSELDDRARQAGVDEPDKLPNKSAVIDAIIAKTVS